MNAVARTAIQCERLSYINENKLKNIANLPLDMLEGPVAWLLYDQAKLPYAAKTATFTPEGRGHAVCKWRDPHVPAPAQVAYAALGRHPASFAGLSFLLDRAHGIGMFDLDCMRKALTHKDYADMPQEQKDRAIARMGAINADLVARLSARGAYVERSISGAGHHIAAKLSRPIKRAFFKIEGVHCGAFYTHNQLVHMTGDIIAGAPCMKLPDLADEIEKIIDGFITQGVMHEIKGGESLSREELLSAGVMEAINEANGRKLHLNAADLIATMRGRAEKPNGRMYAHSIAFFEAGETLDFSKDAAHLIKDMSKVEASAAAAFGWLEASPAFAGMRADGKESRRRWLLRRFLFEWAAGVASYDSMKAQQAAEADALAREVDISVLYDRPSVPAAPPAPDPAAVEAWGLACAAAEAAGLPKPPFPQDGFLAAPEAPADEDETDDSDGASEATEAQLRPAFPISFPDCAIGCLASDFMEMQHYRNQTVAVVWAFNMIAAFAQRHYHINGMGVNLYDFLMGKTALGKERMIEGRNILISAVNESRLVPQHLSPDIYFGPGKYASGVSLVNHINFHKRQASIFSEASFLFASLKNKNDTHAASSRSALLELKPKSGRHGRMDGKAYAKGADLVPSCDAPSFTVLAEGQPDKLYRALDAEMAEDGLLNRFDIFDASTARRGKRNKQAGEAQFSSDSIRTVALLISRTAEKPPDLPNMKAVQVSGAAQALFDEYEEGIVDQLDSERDKIRADLFGRSLMSAYVRAALMAILEDPDGPMVDESQARFAIDLVYRERCHLLEKFKTDGIGGGQAKQIAIVIKALKSYIGLKSSSLKVTAAEQKAGIFRRFWINQKVKEFGAVDFQDLPNNPAAKQITDCLNVLKDEGVIIECDNGKEYSGVKVNYIGKVYQIIDLKKYK